MHLGIEHFWVICTFVSCNQSLFKRVVRISMQVNIDRAMPFACNHCKYQAYTKGSYHNSKPVKVGKPSHRGGGLGFYLVFPNLEVGKWFLLGGVSKSTR